MRSRRMWNDTNLHTSSFRNSAFFNNVTVRKPHCTHSVPSASSTNDTPALGTDTDHKTRTFFDPDPTRPCFQRHTKTHRALFSIACYSRRAQAVLLVIQTLRYFFIKHLTTNISFYNSPCELPSFNFQSIVQKCQDLASVTLTQYQLLPPSFFITIYDL